MKSSRTRIIEQARKHVFVISERKKKKLAFIPNFVFKNLNTSFCKEKSGIVVIRFSQSMNEKLRITCCVMQGWKNYFV